MLPEINATNPAFKIFHSSVVGSMQEAERKRKKKEPTRLKKVSETKNQDKYSSTTKDNLDKDDIEVKESLSKQESQKRKKRSRHTNKQYATSAYEEQDSLTQKMEETKAKPMAEI